MIITYSYLDQYQQIGQNTILSYHYQDQIIEYLLFRGLVEFNDPYQINISYRDRSSDIDYDNFDVDILYDNRESEIVYNELEFNVNYGGFDSDIGYDYSESTISYDNVNLSVSYSNKGSLNIYNCYDQNILLKGKKGNGLYK